MQGLRAKYDVNMRSALANGGPFLARHTTAHGNAQIGIVGFEAAPAAKLMKHLFLGFLAN